MWQTAWLVLSGLIQIGKSTPAVGGPPAQPQCQAPLPLSPGSRLRKVGQRRLFGTLIPHTHIGNWDKSFNSTKHVTREGRKRLTLENHILAYLNHIYRNISHILLFTTSQLPRSLITGDKSILANQFWGGIGSMMLQKKSMTN